MEPDEAYDEVEYINEVKAAHSHQHPKQPPARIIHF